MAGLCKFNKTQKRSTLICSQSTGSVSCHWA